MNHLDVIIPVKNEEENVEALAQRINWAMVTSGLSYQMIFVDDGSTDGTTDKIIQLSKNYPIKLLFKNGKAGKAYRILQGSRVSEAEYLAMIDGDLQYPPEALPQMYRLARENGVAVANRANNQTKALRQIGTKLNGFAFDRLLFGLKCDVQSGLKVFRREIIQQLDEADVSPWTLDLPLLHTARELGHDIETVDIDFEERKNGVSKVNFVQAAAEIGWAAVKLRLNGRRIYSLPPAGDKTMVGAGLAHKGRRFMTHTTLAPETSALKTLVTWQKATLVFLLSLLALGLLLSAKFTAIVFIALLSLAYFLDVIFSLYVLIKSLHFPPEIKFSAEELEGLNDDGLPVYTVLCPLYKEGRILPHFLAALESIDWPKEKLDVILLLEEDDEETRQVLETISLPAYVRFLTVPDSQPRTKPKACNYGLNYARGEFLVVYDAEDRPDPLQLKKAYLAFSQTGPEVVCLQSKLNYYNPRDNLLTKLFTAEYSLWFDIILPGLQSIETIIPLGGTSNHFRTRDLRALHAWDPFNVTEDCDLGARLFKAGYKTAMIDSTTYEEANSQVKNWLRQRSRWIKGYLQTYLVHLRQPVGFLRRHGVQALIFQLVVGMRMVFMLINPILWLATFSYFALNHLVGPTIEALYPTPVFYMAVTSAVFGNFMYLYSYMIGAAKRGYWWLIKFVFLVPLYWLLASIAATIALYQLALRPHFWEKTHHALHLRRAEAEKAKELAQVGSWVEASWRWIGDLVGGRLAGAGTGVFAALLVSIISFYLVYLDGGFSLEALGQFGFLASLFILVGMIIGPRTVKGNLIDFLRLFAPLPANGVPADGRLKILIFNWRDTKHVWAGGAEVYLHELARRWVAQGHLVTQFCGNDRRSKPEEMVDGVNIVRRGGFYSVYLWAFLYHIFRFRGQFDLVIDSENGAPFFTPLYSRVPKFLLAYHVHQEVFRQHLRFPLSALAVLVESKLMPLVYRNQKIITISTSSKEDLINLGWPKAENIDIVHPGVNGFNYQRKFAKTDYPSFVYLGRLKPYKNIDVALKAFARVVADRPEARMTIAGEGESLGVLKDLADKLKLNSTVKFVGRISEAEKIRLLSQSWLALQPSSFEGWGITVIEANQWGTPVVAAEVSGLKDSVVNGSTGILIPVKDAEALAHYMSWLSNNPTTLTWFSANAHQWAQRFSWEKSSAEFLNKIDLLLAASEAKIESSLPRFGVIYEAK